MTDDSTITQPADFLQSLFLPGEYALIRPIETWNENGQKKSKVDYKGVQYILVGGRDQAGNWRPEPQRLVTAIKRHNERSEQTKANIFFGVCPRFGGSGRYDQAWQIRTVRALWTDVDHCTAEDVVKRRKDAGLPEPSIIVASGNGVHAYWLLSEPYLIDDVGDPQPVFTEFIDQGVGKRKVRKYIKNGKENVYIDGKDKRNAPLLSPKAQQFQDILAGIAAKINGDHTTDLSRLLRLPGTLNRKDQRNAREPIPCTLVVCDSTRRYPISDFARYAEESPDRIRREAIAKVKLPSLRKLSAPKRDRFNELLLTCSQAEVGGRSDADFALCCWSVEHGVPRELVWTEAHNVGKFAEAGERYFNVTWENAEQQTRQRLFNKAQPKVQSKTQPGNLHVIENVEAHRTDVGNAKRLVIKYGHLLRHCWAWRKWFAWDGKRWRLDEEGHVQRLARQTVLSMYSEAADLEDREERSALIDHALQSERASRIAAIIDLARSETGIPVLPQDLDSDTWLLNVVNGTLDLRTGNLTPHNPQQMITKLCRVEYHANAPAPTWKATLDDIFLGQQNLVDYLQRFLGYCLTGGVAEQILAIFWGIGANGKSTLLDVILDLLGEDYSMKAPTDLLMAKRQQSHPTEQADLHGKRLVICVETDQGRRMAESLVKELTGGDKIRARRMREDFWQFSATHKIVLACNHKPTVRGTDHAIWRRLRLVPFNRVFKPDEQDKQLGEKLRRELPGILAWCVRGCFAWQAAGLGTPEEVAAATSDYQIEQDQLATFLTEACLLGDGLRVRAATLFDAYEKWSGDKYMTQCALGRELQTRGYKKVKSNGVWYLGIGLSESSEHLESGAR
jgi:P4 family phage/plasmid primase-like protien